MIRRLRIWHRVWFALLAILLPVLLFLALRDRPSVPRADSLPTAGAGELDHDQGERP